jgi:hypothetical protein
LAFIALYDATGSPAVNYATNTSLNVNVKSAINNKNAEQLMMLSISTEDLIKKREKP